MSVKETIEHYLKAIGIDEDSALLSLFDHGISLAPYVGEALQTLKINRLQRRLNEHTERLKRIELLCGETRISRKYIEERIFPIVLVDLLEEHEDAKVVYIFNGFCNVFIEEKTDESMVLQYFDTLRGLRYADVRRLFYYADLDDPFPVLNEASIDGELSGMIQGIDSKLERFGLIASIRGSLNINPVFGKEEILITRYGSNFIRFFSDPSMKDVQHK